MADQWFTIEQIKAEQKACPLSMGQAEAGRYTFCVGDQCMAWTWDNKQPTQLEVDANNIPDGWAAISKPYKKGKKEVVDIMKKPTHGRCGMVPRNVD